MDSPITIIFSEAGSQIIRSLEADIITTYPNCSFVLASKDLEIKLLDGEMMGLTLHQFNLMMAAIENEKVFEESDEIQKLLDYHGLIRGFAMAARKDFIQHLNGRMKLLNDFELGKSSMYLCESVDEYKRIGNWMIDPKIVKIQIIRGDNVPIFISIGNGIPIYLSGVSSVEGTTLGERRKKAYPSKCNFKQICQDPRNGQSPIKEFDRWDCQKIKRCARCTCKYCDVRQCETENFDLSSNDETDYILKIFDLISEATYNRGNFLKVDFENPTLIPAGFHEEGERLLNLLLDEKYDTLIESRRFICRILRTFTLSLGFLNVQ